MGRYQVTLTLGLKLTHDAAVAVIEDGVLRFSIEMEKIRNAERHAMMSSEPERQIRDVLLEEGLVASDIKYMALDGWYHGRMNAFPHIRVAPYHEGDQHWGDPLRGIGTSVRPWIGTSYPHVTNHIVGAYAMSPWAKAKEPSYVIMWDGGTSCRLYHIDPRNREKPIRFLCHLLHLYATVYGIMGYYAGPYSTPVWPVLNPLDMREFRGSRDWPGKLMSYIGLGVPAMEVIQAFADVYRAQVPDFQQDPLRNTYANSCVREHAILQSVRKKFPQVDDASFLASFHTFLETELVERALSMIPRGANLIFTGGAALNIKWNSALRETGHFGNVFVPPCPNDSGNAIGAAAVDRVLRTGQWDIAWSVYAGPKMPEVVLFESAWQQEGQVTPDQVAQLLIRGHVVVMLRGRAEIGPRALGHRSLLALPYTHYMRVHLNEIKNREEWRPVAPLVLEEDAPLYFTPGSPDPYMLFDHRLTGTGAVALPAIHHADGTARIQTITEHDDAFIAAILRSLKELGLPPVLCNTSANFNGSGFFPNAESAMRWNKAPYIIVDDTLYKKL